MPALLGTAERRKDPYYERLAMFLLYYGLHFFYNKLFVGISDCGSLNGQTVLLLAQ